VFVAADNTTQGSWQGVYGKDGYVLAEGPAAPPPYAQVTPAGHLGWTWEPITADPRGLQLPGGGRLAATWYNDPSFTVGLNLTDGQPHQVAIYFVDWDFNGRSQRVTFENPASGQVLDTRDISGFTGGRYLVYTVTGDVRIRVTNLSGVNAVLSGLFFGPASGAGEAVVASAVTTHVEVDPLPLVPWREEDGTDSPVTVVVPAAVPTDTPSRPAEADVGIAPAVPAEPLNPEAPLPPARIDDPGLFVSIAFDPDPVGVFRPMPSDLLNLGTDDRPQPIVVPDAMDGPTSDAESGVGFVGEPVLVGVLAGSARHRDVGLDGPAGVFNGVFVDPIL
jgi:hypothetical protein